MEPRYLLLMDLEFTCWGEASPARWDDERRPREVVAVELAAFDTARNEVLDTFQEWVRPAMNPELSPYCRDLLRVSQVDIDRARPLPAVLARVSDWIGRDLLIDAPTCSWGFDRRFLAADVRRQCCGDPFAGRHEINVMTQVRRMLGLAETDFLDRDHARAMLQLPAVERRHDALGDAVDLIGFCHRLGAHDPSVFAPPPGIKRS